MARAPSSWSSRIQRAQWAWPTMSTCCKVVKWHSRSQRPRWTWNICMRCILPGKHERRLRYKTFLIWAGPKPRSGNKTDLFCAVAADAQLVAVTIAEVGAIIIGVVMRPQARRAFTDGALRQHRCVAAIHLRAAAGQEGDHLSIAGRCLQTVVGRAQHEQRS